jgi:acetylornithine deacetylase/succinyl-diaminopimelate desuccinylase-like protein
MALLSAARERQDSGRRRADLQENAPMGATAIPLDVAATKARVAALMPEAIADLKRLVGMASVAAPGFPSEPVHAMASAVCDLFTRAGLPEVRLMDPGGGYPMVYANVPGPVGSPTVLLYGHYDVQPATVDQGWTTDPWTLTKHGSRLFGRGASDDKSGVLIHALTIRLFAGQLPVGLKLVIEGEEETFSHLEAFVEGRPDLFEADVMVLHEHRPVGVRGGATRPRASHPFIVDMAGPAVSDARVALAAAYGREVSTIVSAGAVPLLGVLAKAYPDAEFVLWGADDANANVHGTNESVDPSEIELMALAQAILMESLASRG